MFRPVEVAAQSKSVATATFADDAVDSAAGVENRLRSWPSVLASLVIRMALAIGLAYCGYLATKQGISAWYLRQNAATALQNAIRWDAANPQSFSDLGTLTHMYADGGSPGEIVRAYETATQLSPRNAAYWADLGAAYDWAGRRDEARAAFDRARQLFPNSPDINWRVANFYVRAGESDESLQYLKKALAGTSVPRRDVFALASRATPDNQKILTRVLPVDQAILIDFLNFRVQQDDIEGASQTWHHLLETNVEFGARDALAYFDALIRHRKLSELNGLWSTLSTRFPLETHASGGTDGNLILNGGFEDEILNGGWDWRIAPVNGAGVALDADRHRDGGRSLRIDFDGTANLEYGHVFQYVRVKPGTRYRFSAYMRTEGITTDSGPFFEIYDAYDMRELWQGTQGLVGTAEWSRRELDFTTKANTELLVVRVARRPSRKLANQIGGTVWVDRIDLEVVP